LVVAFATLIGACRDERRSEAPVDAPSDPSVRFRFTDEAAARGLVAQNHCGSATKKRYLLEEIGNGCALFDMDGDGDLDAFLPDSCALVPPKEPNGDFGLALDGECRLFENDGHGRFRDVTAASGAGLRCFAQGATAADYDGDGDLDLYVTCYGPNHLLQNDGRGRFADVTARAGVGDDHWSVGSAFFDADGDGDLDLYVANYFAMTRARDPDCWKKVDCPYFDLLAACGPKGMVPEPDTFYVNNGDGTFRDASVASGIRDVPDSYGLGVVAFDYDDDGDQDVYVANDSRAHNLFENDGKGRFTDVGDLMGCALSRSGLAQAGMGVGCGDFDGDLDLDLFLTNFSHDDPTLYQNDGAKGFFDVTSRHAFGVEAWLALSWGTEFVDFDGDGDLDLFVANGHVYPEADRRAPELTYAQVNRVYLNEEAHFRDVTGSAGPGLRRKASFRGAAFGDVDGDGDQDVLVAAQNEPPSLLINHAADGAGAGAIHVSLEGSGMNRFAVGARVVAEVGTKKLLRTVRAGGSFASSSTTALHFGLGAQAEATHLTVTWPNGKVESADHVAGGSRLCWREGGRPVETTR
jgi:hypothetical protein